MNESFFDKHRKTLDGALEALRTRAHWSPYPEIPSGKIYGETAKSDGAAAFEARLGKPFELDQPQKGSERIGAEVSPYGLELKITYPAVDLDTLLPAVQKAMGSWAAASIEERTGVCLEILHRLNRNSFEMANAAMHTTGQGFAMAFQAAGPHAQDRGLEAVAHAFQQMNAVPREVVWEKRVSKTDTIQVHKTYRIRPRGVALVIACSTFPTWNTYPGLFASLCTGNAVVIKPHPGAVLPVALTVETARAVLAEAGFDPDVVTLAADAADAPITKQLALRPEIGIIDYTGGSEFGEWLEQNARHAELFTEKSGINSVIVDSTDDLKGMSSNLAFSLSLYSGQMCTAPQNIFIPKDGIDVNGERVSFDDVVSSIATAIDKLLADYQRAAGVLGAIQSPRTMARLDQAASGGGNVARASHTVTLDESPNARVASPLFMKVTADDTDAYMQEMFGPISYAIATEDTEQSLRLAGETALSKGAITWGLYTTDPRVIDRAEAAAACAGVPLSTNLVGMIFVNQAAAFSDYHVSGANPAGNATLCDAAFVTPRFRVVQARRLAPASAPA